VEGGREAMGLHEERVQTCCFLRATVVLLPCASCVEEGRRREEREKKKKKGKGK
jgi:hypothetical protein